MNTTIKEELVTPEKALNMLKKNENNRRPKEKVIENYSKEMLDGRWKRNTFELIKISKDNQILDGQHRLKAVVKSGIPIYFHIAYNVDNDVMPVLDTGSKRNASDVLHIKNIKNANIVPSIIKVYTSLINGGINHKYIQMSNSETFEAYRENSCFWDNVSTSAYRLYILYSKLMATSIIGGVYAYISKIDGEDYAEHFFNDLVNGNQSNSNIISFFTKKILDDKLSSSAKLPIHIKVALLLKTYKIWKEGKNNCTFLRYTPSTDNFPFLHKLD